MNESKISTRYAKALFLSAVEKKVSDAVREDMEMILIVIRDIPELKQLLESPVIASGKKDEILRAVFGNKINELTSSFLELLIQKKREDFLAGIARSFIKYYKEASGIKVAVLKTAIQLDKQLKEQLAQIIRKKFNSDIELSELVNESLIGGFVLTVEDQQLDASVSGQLSRIRKELKGAVLKNVKL